MKPRHKVSRAAITLIERFEGYRRQAAQLPDGRWTIGYGHTRSARQGAEVSETDAEALLLYDLMAVAQAVNELTFTPLTQNQFDALCAFAFNIGTDNFRASRVLKLLNEGALLQAACAMELWRKAEFEGETIVVDALVRRRSAEKTLFLTPPNEAWVAVPSAVLRPELDTAAEALVPFSVPAPIVTSLDGEAIKVLREGEILPRPAPPEDHPSPVAAAAEAVRARLATVFADEPAQRPIEATDEAAVLPIPEEARPQADFAPPITVEPAPEPLGDLEAVPPSDLAEAPDESPTERAEAQPDSEPEPEPEREPEASAEPAAEGPEAGKLLAPAPANDARAHAEAQADLVLDQPLDLEPGRERVVIDDLAPYDFAPSPVMPLRKPKDGYLSMVSLAVLGLAFFAGGLFWALNAQPGDTSVWLTPKVVGLLAIVAGTGFFAIALYLFMERLGHRAERGED